MGGTGRPRYLSHMLWIALNTLRFRKTSFLAGFIALFAGATIVMASGGLLETGLRTDIAPVRLAATPVVVTAVQRSESPAELSRLDSSIVRAVQDVPGVAKAVPDISFPATVLRDGQPVRAGTQGHTWASAELAPYVLSSGTTPAGGEVVLSEQDVATTGDRVEVAVAGRVESFRVSGIAGGPKPALFFSANDTARLTMHPGQVDAIGVIPAAGVDDLADRISAALGDRAVVLTGDSRGAAEFPDAVVAAKPLRILAAVFSGWIVLITVFGVSSTIALTIQHRQRELALLRAIGTTPRQVRRMIVGETMVLAVLATALAYVPSRLLGWLLFDQMASSARLEFRQGWIPGVAGACTALLAAFGAALVASKRAAHTSPVIALGESIADRRWLSRWRLVLAVVLLATGISLGVVTVAIMSGPLTASTAGPASIMVAMGLALLAPGIARKAARLVPTRGVTGELAAQTARVQFRRMAAAIVPVVLVTGIGVATLYMQATEDAANQRAFIDNLDADLVVTSPVGGFAPDVVARIRAVPGVTSASELVTGTANFEDPPDSSQLDGWQARGVGDLSGRTAAIPEATASRHGLRIGDTITVRFGDGGRETLQLVDFFPVGKGNERLVVPASLLARHTTAGLPTQIVVRAAPGVSLDHLDVPGMQVSDRSALVAAQSSMHKTLAAANYAVVAMIIAFAVLTVINTLVAATNRRRGELGVLRLAGSTRLQVLRTIGVEGLLVAVTGVVLGSIAALATLLPFSLARNSALIPSGSPWIYAAVIGSVLVVTMTATLWPAWRVTRHRPINTLVGHA
jgi:putative ABC transport system permease protein